MESHWVLERIKGSHYRFRAVDDPSAVLDVVEKDSDLTFFVASIFGIVGMFVGGIIGWTLL
jgi:hypothetical protein